MFTSHMVSNPPNFNPLLTFGGEIKGLEMVPFKIKVKFDQQKWQVFWDKGDIWPSNMVSLEI